MKNGLATYISGTTTNINGWIFQWISNDNNQHAK